jgi:3-deoxy-7-phosphoheptulonate synthase
MWLPSTHLSRPCAQTVEYPDEDALNAALKEVSMMPPLVTIPEVNLCFTDTFKIQRLRSHLAKAAEGKVFLLQGGDCAELFDYCAESHIEAKLKVLLQMSLILTWGGRIPVLRIARMAGQYAKPRSSPTETIDGITVPSFRGDIVNGIAIHDRIPDPQRLVKAYFHASATLNYVRALLSSGFADLHNPQHWELENWSLEHVRSPIVRKSYEEILASLSESLSFMRTIGLDSNEPNNPMNTVEFYMSHEGLLLNYETQFTRKDKSSNKYYNLGAHFLWIGDRTRQIDGAHVEYFRGIANPIGVKVGPSMDPQELVRLLDVLDPDFETGKVTLITRYGASKIEQKLPMHIQAVKQTKHKVVWCCDPMHGNTETVSNGIKTRKFDNILKELERSLHIHQQGGSMLNGVHFELTGDRVTETLGGSMQLSEAELSQNYQTFCDPR